jgi:hypothetical protein
VHDLRLVGEDFNTTSIREVGHGPAQEPLRAIEAADETLDDRSGLHVAAPEEEDGTPFVVEQRPHITTPHLSGGASDDTFSGRVQPRDRALSITGDDTTWNGVEDPMEFGRDTLQFLDLPAQTMVGLVQARIESGRPVLQPRIGLLELTCHLVEDTEALLEASDLHGFT